MDVSAQYLLQHKNEIVVCSSMCHVIWKVDLVVVIVGLVGINVQDHSLHNRSIKPTCKGVTGQACIYKLN